MSAEVKFRSVQFDTCETAGVDAIHPKMPRLISSSELDKITTEQVTTLHNARLDEYYFYVEQSGESPRQAGDNRPEMMNDRYVHGRKWVIVKPMLPENIKSMQQFNEILDGNRAISYNRGQHRIGMHKTYWGAGGHGKEFELKRPPVLYLNERVIVQVTGVHEALPSNNIFNERIRPFATAFATEDELARQGLRQPEMKVLPDQEPCCCVIL